MKKDEVTKLISDFYINRKKTSQKETFSFLNKTKEQLISSKYSDPNCLRKMTIINVTFDNDDSFTPNQKALVKEFKKRQEQILDNFSLFEPENRFYVAESIELLLREISPEMIFKTILTIPNSGFVLLEQILDNFLITFNTTMYFYQKAKKALEKDRIFEDLFKEINMFSIKKFFDDCALSL